MLGSAYLQFNLDYSGTKDFAVDRATVQTQHVSAGGHVWRVRCYPRGWEGAHGYISLYFDLISNSRDRTKAVIEAFVMRSNGEPCSSFARRCVVSYTPGGLRPWVSARFADPSNLGHEYLTRGCITVVCGIIVLGKLATPPSGLANHLGGLLERADETLDVSFLVGGETFPAHRAVLAARSPVFKAELFGPMAEAKMACIKLEDMELDTFRFLLRYVYTDALPGDEELAGTCASADEVFQNLLAAADRYDVDGLKLACAQRLCDGLSVDTVVETLVCAEMHGCLGLKKRCLDYLTSNKKNFEKVAVTEGYSRLAQLFPSLSSEIEDDLKRREDRKRGALALEVGRRWFIKRTRINSGVFHF